MDSPQTSFRLEKGSTGFRGRSDPPLPRTSPSLCRTAWHAAARAAQGRVGDFYEQEYPQSFHRATITDRDGVHVLLFHVHQPLIAFVADGRFWYTDGFLEPPAWGAVLGDVGFVVLGAARLNAPLTTSDTRALEDAELRHIRRWKPATVGAVLFNSWD